MTPVFILNSIRDTEQTTTPLVGIVSRSSMDKDKGSVINTTVVTTILPNSLISAASERSDSCLESLPHGGDKINGV